MTIDYYLESLRIIETHDFDRKDYIIVGNDQYYICKRCKHALSKLCIDLLYEFEDDIRKRGAKKFYSIITNSILTCNEYTVKDIIE